jgi:hypothetical protein
MYRNMIVSVIKSETDYSILMKSTSVGKDTRGVSRGRCKPDLYCGLLHFRERNTDFDCEFFRLPD